MSEMTLPPGRAELAVVSQRQMARYRVTRILHGLRPLTP